MRLVTRSDFDGLCCAAILKGLGIVEDILYTHPKDVQDKKIEVSESDILANVPLIEGCGLWFDHHSSEQERLQNQGRFNGVSEPGPSTARVIYNYYKNDNQYSDKLKTFEEMLQAVDKADSGQYSKEDIENPKGWMMLAFIADPRTSLGYHHSYRISNFDLMKTLPDLLLTKSIDEILAITDFKERIDVYNEEAAKYKETLKKCSKVEGDAVVIDFRGIGELPSGNRFIEYTLFPEQNISVRMVDGKKKEFVMISVGHSIINKSSNVNVGSLMLKYGGGGHKPVGTCQISYNDAAKVLKEILVAINSTK